MSVSVPGRHRAAIICSIAIIEIDGDSLLTIIGRVVHIIDVVDAVVATTEDHVVAEARLERVFGIVADPLIVRGQEDSQHLRGGFDRLEPGFLELADMHRDSADLGQAHVIGTIKFDVLNQRLRVPIHPDEAGLAANRERVILAVTFDLDRHDIDPNRKEIAGR